MKAADDPAGYIGKDSYAALKLNGVRYYNHRIVWCLFNGDVLDGMVVDHIDGNTTNNNINNLRSVSQNINLRNQSLYVNNKTGVTGIKFMNNGHSNYYVAIWYDLCGNQRQRYFSIMRLGEQLAFRLACEYRQQMIMELNKLGAGYSDRHGT